MQLSYSMLYLQNSGHIYHCKAIHTINLLLLGHYVFFSVLDARALALGRALPKNMFFSRLLPISEKNS